MDPRTRKSNAVLTAFLGLLSGNILALLLAGVFGWLAWRGGPHFESEALASDPGVRVETPRWIRIGLVFGLVLGAVRIYFDVAEQGWTGWPAVFLAAAISSLLTGGAWLLIRRVWSASA